MSVSVRRIASDGCVGGYHRPVEPTERFADRFLAETYRGDEPVQLTCRGSAVLVPERLFARAQSVARAYELHLLPAIDIYASTRLNRVQCVTLLEEIALVASVLSDGLLREHLSQVYSLVSTCIGLSEGEVIIEGP
jgi:hypothetical protein